MPKPWAHLESRERDWGRTGSPPQGEPSLGSHPAVEIARSDRTDENFRTFSTGRRAKEAGTTACTHEPPAIARHPRRRCVDPESRGASTRSIR